MDREIYYGYILKGDLLGATDYLRQFSEQRGLYERYRAVFEDEAYIRYDVSGELNGILTDYQRYYRDVFYLRVDKEQAAGLLRNRLAARLGVADADVGLSVLEQERLPGLFRNDGLHFLGGKTSGYYGPYVWRTTETVSYEVELPEGVQFYAVNLLDGFLTRGWIDYLSFGQIGPGGWADDGVIHCVKSAWDLESEAFRVSLLKHEAQHAKDLFANRDMPSEVLEYRAKLVELIYSSERNLLQQFVQEADDRDPDNGHAMAAYRIIRGFAGLLGENDLSELGIRKIQSMARELFRRDSEDSCHNA